METTMRNLLVTVALLLPAAAFAGGYAVPNVNARDLSMAGSLGAAQKDATAAYVNPAALAGIEGLSVVLDATMIDFRSTWNQPGGTASSESNVKPAWPPSAFASYGGKVDGMGWGVGAGFNIPFGGNVYWKGDWPGRFAVITVDRRTHGMYFTGGFQPLPQIKVGGGLIYYRTTEELAQGLNFISQEGGVALGASGGKVSFDVSTEITPLVDVPLTIGIDYKHKGDQVLTGHAHFDNAPAALGPSTLDQNVGHDLSVPNLLNVALAYRVLPNLLVTGAWTLDRFIVYKRDLFIGDLGTTVLVNRDYKNGYTFRFGAELEDLVPKMTMRAGFLRDIAPTRPEALNASIPDANVWAVALGLGYEFTPGLTVNATYFHAFYDEITTVGAEVFPGTYDTRANIVTVGIAFRPGEKPRGPSAGLTGIR
jgi:long-chain fatty acid transport protein